jgi:hypothetical protein
VGSGENLNFQIRLYETTNEIEIIYGSTSTPNTTWATGASQVGLRGSANTDFNVASFTSSTLTGYTYSLNWQNLITASSNTDAVGITTTTFPASGTTLKWSPSTCTQPTVNASSTSVTSTGFTIGWTNSATYSSGYDVRWRKVDDLPSVASWTTPTTIAAGSSSYTVTGLLDNTYYIYSVQGKCGASSQSNFSQVTTANSSNARGLTQTLAACPNLPSALTSNTITTTTANIVWTAASPAPGNGYEYFLSTSPAAPTAGTTPTGTVAVGIVTAALSGLMQNTQYYFWVRSNCNGTDKSSWVGSSTFTTLAACPGIPTALTSNTITTTSANLAWTAANPVPGIGYEYVLSTSATAPTAGTTPTGTVGAGVLTASLTSLTANTLYYFWVRSDCNGADKSVWSSSSTFRTLCLNESAPTALQAFTTFLPSCWTTATGALANPSTLTYVTSEWGTVSGMGNTGSNAAVKTNLYGSNPGEWIISQPIDLGSTAGLYRLNYKIAVTSYNGTTTQSTLGTHQVRVIISTNGGTTWNLADVIKTYTGAATYSNTGQTETIDLTSYSGVIKIAFVSTTSTTSPDIDFHIDDFIVELIPTCYNPATVSSSNITTTTATINWTAPSGGTAPAGYNWEVRTSGAAGSGATGRVAFGSTSSATLTANVTGLSANTTYTYYVQNDCGSGSTSSWNSGTFFTGYCTPSALSVDGSGITNVTFGLTPNIVNNTTGSEAGTGYYGNYSAQIGNLLEGQTGTVNITFATGYTYDTKIFIDLNNDLDFLDAGEEVYSGVSSNANPTTLVATFSVPTGFIGNRRMRITAGDAGAPATCATGGTYQCFEDYTVNIVAPPACSGSPIAGSATSTVTSVCGGSGTNLGLSGGTTGVTGLSYQWQSSPGGANTWTNLGSSQASSAYVVASITASTDYRVITTCSSGGGTATSSTISVNAVNCQYNVTRNTGITYNSIMSTGTTYTSIGGVDDAKTNNVKLTGTTFKYRGQPVSAFYATTNGWLTFDTTQTTATYTNDLSNAPTRVLAPFWDDLYILGGSTANYNSCMRYQINGTLGSGNADIIIEWAQIERYAFPSPNLNFQVILHESDNSIEYNYGNMQLFAGDANTGVFSYTVGLNGTSPTTQSFNERLYQQRTNFANMDTLAKNALNESPECYTQLLWTPAAAYTGGLPPTATAPANDDVTNATSLTVNAFPCTDVCGKVYTSKNATGSSTGPSNVGLTACSGNEDDDIWFTFNANGPTRISVSPSLGVNVAYQLFDNSGTIIDCRNAKAIGVAEDTSYASLSLGTYFLRVWDTASNTVTNLTSGEYAVCISDIISPPTNDDPAAAIVLTPGIACSSTNSSLPRSLVATPTAGVQTCGAGTPGTPDDDQWFKFTTASDSGVRYSVRVQGVGAYNAVVQLFNGTPSTTNSVSCVNATLAGGLEVLSSSELSPSTDYFVRVYHAAIGSSTANFSICVTADTPACPSQVSPVGFAQVAGTNAALTWVKSSSATEYQIFAGTSLPLAQIATQPGDSSTYQYTGLTASSIYYWYVVPKNSFYTNTSCLKLDSFNTYPPCLVPTVPMPINMTLISATGVWNPTGASSGYFYELRTTGAAGSGATGLVTSGTTASSTDTFVNFTGLTAFTSYNLYVRSNCGAINSSWSSARNFTLGYCSPPSTTLHSAVSNLITNVSIPSTTLNSSNGTNATTGYTSVANTPVANTAMLGRNISYTINTTFSSAPTQFSVWIDYNRNFIFEASEYSIGTVSGTTGTISITPPTTALLGQTAMRLRARSATYASTDACVSFGSGETEDYVVQIIDTCQASTSAVLASTSQSGLINQCVSDAAGWAYYSPPSSPNSLAFGIKKGTSTLTGEVVNLEVGSMFTSPLDQNGANLEHQSFLMGRNWDVTAPSFTGTVDVRFFYDPADTTAVIAARDAALAALTGSSSVATPWKWFKTTGGVPYNAAWRSSISGNKFPATHINLTPIYGILNGVNYVEFSGITSFSGGTGGAGFGASSGVGLPVTWAGFDAVAKESGNDLTWKTASEVNTSHFEVEYSYDAHQWSVGSNQLTAAGSSQTLQTYNFTHKDFATFVYYRIKQVDLDGRSEYSATKLVKRTDAKTFQVSVYPIPVLDDQVLNVEVKAIDKSDLFITILDMNGRIVKSRTTKPTTNSILVEKINVSNLSNGLYQVVIQNGQGKEVVKFSK